MANREIEHTAHALRYEAAVHLRGNENIRSALGYFTQHPEGFQIRVGEFEIASKALFAFVEYNTSVDPLLFQNVAKLKGMLAQGYSINTLSEAVSMCEELRVEGDYEETARIGDVYTEINEKVHSDQWRFASEITDNPERLASALLIEGYGVYAERLFGSPGQGMARTVVLALEEVLLVMQPQSQLLKDAIDWMKEEKEDFSPRLRERLERM